MNSIKNKKNLVIFLTTVGVIGTSGALIWYFLHKNGNEGQLNSDVVLGVGGSGQTDLETSDIAGSCTLLNGVRNVNCDRMRNVWGDNPNAPYIPLENLRIKESSVGQVVMEMGSVLDTGMTSRGFTLSYEMRRVTKNKQHKSCYTNKTCTPVKNKHGAIQKYDCTNIVECPGSTDFLVSRDTRHRNGALAWRIDVVRGTFSTLRETDELKDDDSFEFEMAGYHAKLLENEIETGDVFNEYTWVYIPGDGEYIESDISDRFVEYDGEVRLYVNRKFVKSIRRMFQMNTRTSAPLTLGSVSSPLLSLVDTVDMKNFLYVSKALKTAEEINDYITNPLKKKHVEIYWPLGKKDDKFMEVYDNSCNCRHGKLIGSAHLIEV